MIFQTASKTENLPARGQSVPTVELPKKKTGKYFWIFGGLVSLLIFALAGLAAILFLTSKFRQDDTAVKTPTPAVSPTRRTSSSPEKSPNIDLSNTSSAPEIPAPKPNFTPPAKPTAQGDFNVRADENWQLSNLDVVPNEKFLLLPMGKVNLREIEKDISAEGSSDKKHQSRRLYQEFPTGALLMRTRYSDGKYSKISAVADKKATGIWQNAPDERGKLELCINDNAPDGNDGEFVVSLSVIEL